MDGSSFSVHEWRGGGPPPAPHPNPPHVHHEDDEAWHVLEGTLTFRFGEQTEVADPGSLLRRTAQPDTAQAGRKFGRRPGSAHTPLRRFERMELYEVVRMPAPLPRPAAAVS